MSNLGFGEKSLGDSGTSREPITVFKTEAERKVAQTTCRVIKQFQHLPSSNCLKDKDIADEIAKKVAEETGPYQPELSGIEDAPSIEDIVAKTTELVVLQTIDTPRILVVPKGDVTLGFHPFRLDLSAVNFQPVDRDLLIQHLRTHQQERISATGSIASEKRLEDYLIRGLMDFDDIYMCEPKQRKELKDPEVQSKREAAELWCEHAATHPATYGGKPWKYALISHDTIAANISLRKLVQAR